MKSAGSSSAISAPGRGGAAGGPAQPLPPRGAAGGLAGEMGQPARAIADERRRETRGAGDRQRRVARYAGEPWLDLRRRLVTQKHEPAAGERQLIPARRAHPRRLPAPVALEGLQEITAAVIAAIARKQVRSRERERLLWKGEEDVVTRLRGAVGDALQQMRGTFGPELVQQREVGKRRQGTADTPRGEEIGRAAWR